VENSSSYKLLEAIKGKKFDDSFIKQIEYRPFDRKWIYYSPELISRPAYKVMKHFINGKNLGLLAVRNSRDGNMSNYFIVDKILIKDTVSSLDNCTVFPLYLYPDNHGQQIISDETERIPNLNKEIVAAINKGINPFVTDKTPEPIDILDYIYAVLHSPTYRERYKEFLKIDFPRVPYPENAELFWKLVELGGKLRRLHLLEEIEPKQGMAIYPIDGNNKVKKPQFTNKGINPLVNSDGRVYINDTQYFDNVPFEAWNFYIGGYQPAQKWLKDRKGRMLNFEDVRHYQKMVWVLRETGEVMGEVDGLIFRNNEIQP
jgi:predicted helicase